MKSFKVAQVLILVYFENIEKCLKFASKTAGRNLEFCLRNDRPPCNNKVKILINALVRIIFRSLSNSIIKHKK